jgi:hypothetical protein
VIDAIPLVGDEFDPDVRSCLVSTVDGLGVTSATQPLIVAHEDVSNGVDVVATLIGFVQFSLIWRDADDNPLELPDAIALLNDPTVAEDVLARLYASWVRMANHASRTELPLLAEIAVGVAGAIDVAHTVVAECINAELRRRDGRD